MRRYEDFSKDTYVTALIESKRWRTGWERADRVHSGGTFETVWVLGREYRRTLDLKWRRSLYSRVPWRRMRWALSGWLLRPCDMIAHRPWRWEHRCRACRDYD